VAKIHGVRCFYANRGVGPCSDEVELDRIIPEARGGVYSLANCLIACSSHNGRRQDRTIEDYLQPVPADGPMLVEFRTEG
jgi:5-methylcytosine-specific restriction endonuclease McrA